MRTCPTLAPLGSAMNPVFCGNTRRPRALGGTAGSPYRLPAESTPQAGLAAAQDWIAIDFVPCPTPGVRWLRWRRRLGLGQLGIFLVADHPFRYQQLHQ